MQLMPKPPTSASADDLIDKLGSCSLHLMWALRQDATRAFDPSGLRTMRALLLEFVGRGHSRPKDLAALLGTVPPAVSTMIADLEGRGLISRRGDPNDGRRVQLTLTDAGEATRRELLTAWKETGSKRLGSLSHEELEVFTRLCHKLLEG